MPQWAKAEGQDSSRYLPNYRRAFRIAPLLQLEAPVALVTDRQCQSHRVGSRRICRD